MTSEIDGRTRYTGYILTNGDGSGLVDGVEDT